MSCLYENKVNKSRCNCLTIKECKNCKFYKEKTKENFMKYIVQVERDIIAYRNKKYEGA